MTVESVFELPTLTTQQFELLVRAVHVLGSAAYGGWQSDETAMAELLSRSRGEDFPRLTRAELKLLARGVDALGTIDGWSREEAEMKKLLHSILHP